MNDETKSDSKPEPKKPQAITQRTATVRSGVATKAQNAKVFENTEIVADTDSETGTVISESTKRSFEVTTSGGHIVPEHITNPDDAEAVATSLDDDLTPPPEEELDETEPESDAEPGPKPEPPRAPSKVPKRGM